MRKLRSKFFKRRTSTVAKKPRRRLLLESLESRVVLTGVSELGSVLGDTLVAGDQGAATELLADQAEGEAGDSSARLAIFVGSQEVVLPANIGVNADGSMADTFTDSSGGPVLFDSAVSSTLGDFFDTWRTSAGVAGNNPDAVLSEDQLLANMADTTSTVQMLVNGQLSDDFENHVLADGDEIVLVYGDNPVVSLNTNFGAIVIELFEDETPGTVNNFLNYVNDGDYINSFFHRSAKNMDGSDFVIQGGGFATTSEFFTSTGQFSSVPTDAPITNEPGISNVRGTVAMAKTSDPNSATSQFFVNLNDTNTFLDSPSNSGGFTVFGQVLDLVSADRIAALPVNTSNPRPYNELPVGTNNELPVVEAVVGQGEITGTKFFDANMNGVLDQGESGVAGITVFVDANNNGTADQDEITTTTDADGNYLLQLQPGTYTIRAELSSGHFPTMPLSPDSYTVPVEIGREVSDRDFGETLFDSTPPGDGDNAISGFVFFDADDDGVRDAGEVGIPGAQVTLSGPVTLTMLTPDTGFYSFTDLPDGNYQISERQPRAVLDGLDSTTVPNAVVGDDLITEVAMAGGQSFTENNFGEVRLEPRHINITWFFASASQSAFRDTIALGEEQAGNFELAAAIRLGGSSVPDATNEAPVAFDDTHSVDEDSTLTVAVASGLLGNDTDADGDALTAAIVAGPGNGALMLAGDGSFTYTPNANFFGTDTFTYRASDGEFTSNVATVTITVSDIVEPNTFTVDENSPEGTLVGQLTVEGESSSSLSFNIDDASLIPQLEIAPDDHLSGNAAAPVVLIEYLDYQCPVCRSFHPIVEQMKADFGDDLLVVTRHLPLVTIHPNAFAAARAAEAAGRQGMFDEMGDLLFSNQDEWNTASNPQSFFEAYATDLGLDLTQLLTDLSDPEIDDRINRDSNVAMNELGTSATPTFYLGGEQITPPGTVEAFNALIQAEVDAVDQVFSVNRQSGEIFVLDTSALDFETTPSFTLSVTATNIDGTSSQIMATIDLNNVNESTPVASEDAYSVDENSFLQILAANGVLENDSDADGDSLNAQLISSTTNGLLTLASDGSFEYTPNANFNGTDSFTYQASDGSFASLTTTVTITVNPQPSAPIAVDDGFVIDEDQALNMDAASGLLINDSDPDGDAITAQVSSAPSNGTVTVNNDGSFSYIPDADFSGSDSFTYQANDGSLLSPEATVTVTVNEINDPPTAVDDAYGAPVNDELVIDAQAGVLANDTDLEGDSLAAALETLPTSGSVTLNLDGSFTYTPNTDFNGTDTFTYTVNDGEFTSQAATVTITINNAPDASDDAYDVDEDTELVINSNSGVLANDSDQDGDVLTASVVDFPDNGTLNLASDGSFTYQPNADFNGSDSFTYIANDGLEDSAEVTVMLTVNAVNDAPEAEADSFDAVQGSTLTVDAANGLLSNDSDIDSAVLSVELDASPASGSLTIQADGSFTYTPTNSAATEDTFTYVVNDGTTLSDPATVTITIAPEELLQFRLEVASQDGTPTSTLNQGDDFLLNVFVEDVRANAEGVFSAYLDVLYDSTLVGINGSVTFGPAFPNGQDVDVAASGVVDELGAFSGTTAPPGPGEMLLATIPMTANAVGTAEFNGDFADLLPVHDSGLFGIDDPVLRAQTRFVDDIVEIIAASGEGEGPAAAEAAVDHVLADVWGSE